MRTPLAALALLAAASPAVAQDYRKDVQPLLRERCYACHGVLQQKAKLRLDTGAAMTAAGAVVPGKAAGSELIARVTATDDTRMPPEGHALTAEQVAKLRAWIDGGAKVPADDRPEPDPRDHWAFRPVVKPTPPAAGNPIDAFVVAGRGKLTPVGPADKRVLLRRVYLDLIGLPPTPAQQAAFETDARPDAYERVVDELLASPQYGERWARHFLDIWRYSDWWGLGAELRNSQRHVWRWRDWAVEAFAADVGYDEMVRQMLAADELYPTDPLKLRATGYLARPYFLFNRTTWLDEVVEHTGKGLMGLTTNCAKCHDHKYDPVTQTDYYRLRAVFEPYQLRTDLTPDLDEVKAGLARAFDANPDAKTPFHVRGDERTPDKTRVVEPGLPRFLAPTGLTIEPVKLPLLAVQPGLRPDIAAAHVAKASAAADAAKLRARAAAKAQAVVGGPSLGVVLALEKATKAADDALAAAREFEGHAKAGTVPPPALAQRFPGAVRTRESNLDTDAAAKARPYPTTSTGRRTALARWLTDRSNPLTARVVVNHVWLRHVGQPLVPTVFDFGRKGTAPTHPELLDWLAADFMEHGWSFKHLHRVVVTSGVYRLSSSAKGAEASAAADPENRKLWRMNPTRMTAQTIRDSLLHLSGELDLTRGGPPIPLAEQDTSRRRAMYFFQSHNDHHKLLSIFDDANVLDCYRRTESVVPQQALALWNSGFAIGAAGKIAGRIPAADDAAFVTAAFETVLGTTPSAAELTACVEGLAELRAANGGAPAERTRRARALLVQALVNHNDFVTVR
ncbi:PSD1 and planctomycete cytochrome C domain-containing protein [Urbifossiella limnaea]|uniref:Planctomycete cytochrome C n=1 Tax=Urbifossiella limnaea TaxID=2528023 RepID=A0A517Y0M4_9BACT|nr:PSD1 and planctomycete cytochrome C domain-containing protein [Urbifossiella limnaea]QDU23258.1 Planctomycete cytochrome C [Urbifossiella limnaea]